MPKIALKGSDRSFDCAEGDTVLRAGLRAGLGLAYGCNVGACGECKFELAQGVIQHYERPLAALAERDVRRGRHLACQARPSGDCVVVLHPEDRFVPRDPPLHQTAHLQSVEAITDDLTCFTFHTLLPARFRPGQYALLKPAGVGGWRPYSMSNLSNDAGVWQFMVRHVTGGEASAYFFERRVLGDAVEMDGPYGMAFYRPSAPEVVCVAGGSGLAPALSIARAAAEDGACKRVTFFYGGRTPPDLCAKSFLDRLARPGLTIVHHGVASGPSHGATRTWDGPKGFIHQHLGATLEPNSAGAQFYVAGPPAMVDAVNKVLAANFAVPPENIHYDRFF